MRMHIYIYIYTYLLTPWCRVLLEKLAASLLKKRMTDSVLLWCMLQAGPPSLHYYCAVVLYSCIVLPPIGHFSNH